MSRTHKRQISEALKYRLDEADPAQMSLPMGKDYANTGEQIQDELWGSLEKTVRLFVQKYGDHLDQRAKSEIDLEVEEQLGELSRIIMRHIDPSYDPSALPDPFADED